MNSLAESMPSMQPNSEALFIEQAKEHFHSLTRKLHSAWALQKAMQKLADCADSDTRHPNESEDTEALFVLVDRMADELAELRKQADEVEKCLTAVGRSFDPQALAGAAVFSHTRRPAAS